MKKIFVLVAVALVSFSAFAQESNKDASGKIQFGPYETNKFWDNWFVEAGAGINTAHDRWAGKIQAASGLNVQAAVGKWFDPCFGARLGYQGISTGNAIVAGQGFGALKSNYIHADFLWNFSNTVAGYKENRIVNFVPYLTTGASFAKRIGYPDGRSFTLGFGLEVPIRVTPVFNIVPQFQAVALKGNLVGNHDYGVAMQSTAALLLRFNLGKNNWTRKATTVAGYVSAVAAAEAAANAAQAAKDKANAKAAKLGKQNKSLQAANQQLKDELAKASADNAALMSNILNTPIIAYFEIGKAKLSKQELAHVDYAVKTLLANGKGIKFTLAGNADSKTGTKKRNMQLSQMRADYLYKILTEKYGLDGSNFTIKANGGNDIFDIVELNRAVIIEKN